MSYNTRQAIPTVYNGYCFRSRLEARWAVFFDSLGEEWEYEVEGFTLPSQRYLPDFWLPRLECWVEIKGEQPTDTEYRLCSELAVATESGVVLASGLPTSPTQCDSRGYWETQPLLGIFCDTTDSGGGYCDDDIFWALDAQRRLCLCVNDDRSDRDFWTAEFLKPFIAMKQLRGIIGPVPQYHIDAAKRARFEHGESGIHKKIPEKAPKKASTKDEKMHSTVMNNLVEAEWKQYHKDDMPLAWYKDFPTHCQQMLTAIKRLHPVSRRRAPLTRADVADVMEILKPMPDEPTV